jgi:DNA-binding LacI/PurR family transcriptional regulator
MLKAAAELAASGVVRVVIGQGITVAGEPAAAAPAAAVEPKWRALCGLISRDIATGGLAPHRPLPSLKALRQRYGVSYHTLRRTLEALTAEGALAGSGRTLLLATPSLRPEHATAAGKARVVFVSHGSGPHNLDFDDPRAGDLLRSLERECSFAGVGLDVVGYDDHNPRRPPSAAGLAPREWVLGYLLFLDQIRDPAGLLERLAGSGKPIAVLSTAAAFSELPSTTRSPTRLFISGFTPTCGLDVGRYLVQLGHRRVAFISPYHGGEWSQNRLAGLRQAFAQAGQSDAVREYTRGEYRHNDEYLRAASRGMSPGRQTLLPPFPRPMPRLLAADIASLREQYLNLLRDREILRHFVPLFEQALAEPGVTAWVCVIDYIALLALRFLEGRGVAVPRRLSVIGFDDLPQSLGRGLSTYRFDMATLAHDMLAHVLRPDWRPLAAMPRTVEIAGMVVERATSAPPARRETA